MKDTEVSKEDLLSRLEALEQLVSTVVELEGRVPRQSTSWEMKRVDGKPVVATSESVQQTVANPSPLGLLGFGIVTLVAAVQKLPYFEDEDGRSALTAVTGILVGGLAQLLAGMWEFKRNNTFGATAFTIYGAFWMSQGFYILFTILGVFLPADGNYDLSAMFFFFIWALVTLMLFVSTFRLNIATVITVACVVGVYIFDGLSLYSKACEYVSAVFGLLAGFGAFYIAFGDLTNELYNKAIVHLGHRKEHALDYDPKKGAPYVPKLHFHKSAFSHPHL